MLLTLLLEKLAFNPTDYIDWVIFALLSIYYSKIDLM
jgi:hypothetical protein